MLKLSDKWKEIDMSIRSVCVLFLLLLLILSPFVASAHSSATGVVKERMELMSDLGKHMKTVADMMKGREPFNPVKAVEAGRFISQASPKLPPLFPEDSLKMPSEATPSVWQNWSQFEALFEELEAKSASWAEVSQAGDRDSIIQQFAIVGKVCSNCHTDFRKKNENH